MRRTAAAVPLLTFPLVALALVVAAGCGSVGRADASEQSRGKQLFQQKCASCHSLADAGAKGRIGPDLDEAFRYVRNEKNEGQGFDPSTIRDVVKDQIAYPVVNPATDATGMPANLVTGSDADAVATYVAAVAGVPGRQGGAQAAGGGAQARGGGATDGKAIFDSAGCAGCHTLAAAGSTGTTGPNLDEAKPSLKLAIDRVTNGKGVMPSFKDSLSKEQIRAVAEFVSK